MYVFLIPLTSCKTVNLSSPIGIVIGCGLNQTIEFVNYLTATNYDDTYTAYA